MFIDLYFLPNAQKNNLFLKINLNSLNDNEISLAKNILLNNRVIIEKKDADLNFNISKDKFDCEFLSNQKIFLAQHFSSVFTSQTDISQFISIYS